MTTTSKRYTFFIPSIVRRAANYLRRLRKPSVMQETFHKIFAINYWGSEHSRSGGGSDLFQTRIIRQALPQLVKERGIRKILDVPCGDFYWMSQVDFGPDFQYIGIDVVPELIENNNKHHRTSNRRFIHLDASRANLPKADLIFSRDLLVHFSYQDAARTLMNFKASGATWLLTTTFTDRDHNNDIQTGDWRTLNLQLPPFNFPLPTAVIVEGCTEFKEMFIDKTLGLWKFDDISSSVAALAKHVQDR